MKKIAPLLAVLVLFCALPASAAPKEELALPSHAVEVAPGLYKLGQKYDVKSDSFVEGYAFVHKKNEANSNAVSKAPKNAICYAVMANDAKWKNVEGWQVFSGAGLDNTELVSKLSRDIATWEVAAANLNILGTGILGVGTPADPYALDDLNQVSFGNLKDNTIAVTVTWGTWSGPAITRKIVAWDQIYNTDYVWSTAGEAGKMDFSNIATHELGHAMGLADVYQGGCSSVTMYGYAAPGETNKQTLDLADVTGINLLY